VTSSSSAQAAKNRLIDDQARLRVQAMRARLVDVSDAFETRFRALLARRLGEAAKSDLRFAALAALLEKSGVRASYPRRIAPGKGTITERHSE
jgi:hypothetical protein